MRFLAGTATVAAAATRVQVKNTNDKVLMCKFRSDPGNTGNAFLGNSDVSATVGWTLEKNDTSPFFTLNFREIGGSVLASTFWVDAANNGDKVQWILVVE